MPVFYDQDSDTLRVILGPEAYEPFVYEAGDFAAFVDEELKNKIR